MHENRRSPRLTFDEAITIEDTFSGEALGLLGNLSASGFMLISGREMEADLLLQVSFGVPCDDDDGDHQLEVGARTLWCQETRVPDRYWVGCQIVDISDEDQDFLSGLQG